MLAIAAILVVAAAITAAGMQDGASIGNVRVFAACAALAFLINWAVFVPSFIRQTEQLFDITGSATYVSVVALALIATGHWDLRSVILAVLVAAWAFRLGTFLFVRVRKAGADERFDDLKPSFTRFLMAWTLQGLWVLLTVSAALAAITAEDTTDLGWVSVLGIVVWVAGFGIEVIADQQKRSFRNDPANRGRFITSGLWAWSRHPNYFGEIALWAGIALIAAPALSGWQWVTMVSPVFVFVLLTRISGIPLLEARGRKRWGSDPEYRTYVERTPALFPRPPR